MKRVVILPDKVRIELLIAKKAGKGGENDRNETLYGATGRDRTSDLGLMSPTL